jgi:hypothetical protein
MHQWCASLGTEHFISRMSGRLLFWMIQLLQGGNIIITTVGRYCNYFIPSIYVVCISLFGSLTGNLN